MTYEEKSEIVIRQLREDRDRLLNAIENIRAEIEHWESDNIQDDYQMGAMDMQKYALRVIDKYIKER